MDWIGVAERRKNWHALPARVVLLTKVGETRGEAFLGQNQKFCFGHVTFEMPV